MNILTINNLTKKFDGVFAVNNLSLAIEKRKITSIIGPNGSGKTTLINLLSGILRADSGEIIVSDSQDISKIKPCQVLFFGLTRTFQNVRLFEQMNALDNILVVLTERNVLNSLFEQHKEYHLQKAKNVLQKVGLWEKREELVINLSYGQRKLLEIARVLAVEAEIYLLDEPFAGLFPEMVKVVKNIIEELRSIGKTIILIEHNMELIRKLSDFVYVIDEGKLLAKGKPAEVLERKDVIEAYLGD